MQAVRSMLATYSGWTVATFDPRETPQGGGVIVFPFLFSQSFDLQNERGRAVAGQARITLVIRASDATKTSEELYGEIVEQIEKCVEAMPDTEAHTQTGTGILWRYQIQVVKILGYGGHVETTAGVNTWADLEVHWTQTRIQ